MSGYIEDYFKTAFASKLMVNMPEREDDHLTPATKLLEKRREMSEVEQALAAQKEEFQMKMEGLNQRRDELERKEFQLKESLLKFDKFLKENDSKRARAIKKAHDEKELKKQKEKEIVRLHDETQKYEQLRDGLHKKLVKSQSYQLFMDKVLEQADDFHEIREIIARFDTLTFTREELMEKELTDQEKFEEIRHSMSRFVEDKNNEILQYNNQLSRLQDKLDAARADALEWESKWQHVKNTASAKIMLLGKVKMAIHNLYLLVMRHGAAAHKEQLSDNIEEQLDRILLSVQDLSEITTEIQRHGDLNQPTQSSITKY